MKHAPKWFTATFLPAVKIFVISSVLAAAPVSCVSENGERWQRQAIIELAKKGIEL